MDRDREAGEETGAPIRTVGGKRAVSLTCPINTSAQSLIKFNRASS